MRVAIVAGESSGDQLGAGLVAALRRRVPDLACDGVAGPRMQALGCRSDHPMERLAIMGLVEVLGRFRELSAARRSLIAKWLRDPPDVFIGVDAPDFNFFIERRLRKAGIPTVHYVSPSVWAWRRYRVARIARSTDLMLTLFPFEAAFYAEHAVPVRFVGHPLADDIPLRPDLSGARARLGVESRATVVALLPGSRESEIRFLGGPFLGAAKWLQERRPDIHFIAPVVNQERCAQLREMAGRLAPDTAVTFVEGRSREVMAAADVVLLASGTATLEAMLLKRPMVVSYRLAPMTYRIARRMVHVPYVSLPNLLANAPLVPELLQDEATPEKLGAAVLAWLDHPQRQAELVERFTGIHEVLRRGASDAAAEAVLEQLGGGC